uniref:Uncharacterized protein n=1 Tax=Myoviridae sp. ctzzS20 TaxID=2825215 RepID=A0A8S5P5V9_9CAUD|nr:MAG TPA: hypothetical protein [Myoviridae sp. ctzzS20]
MPGVPGRGRGLPRTASFFRAQRAPDAGEHGTSDILIL